VISVVIPALNEEATLGALLHDVSALGVAHEVIVVDGGSTDGTLEIAQAHGVSAVVAPRGRGTQLRAGAELAGAPLLCFLHADVRLPAAARGRIARLAIDGSEGAWAFRLRIDGRRWSFRLIEWGANARSSLLGLPYGDQGLVISRPRYDAAGGFANVPLMEDVLLARGLQQFGGITLLPETVVASARRWERDGALRRSARNLWLLARFMAGTSPAALAARYEPGEHQ
jgi:rSAM/selenodomain-associated transferase 2